MNEVLQFLKDNPTFYIATIEGNEPRVRPFGFVMEYGGKLCFCTNNKKDVYKQLRANPRFEISTTSKTGTWPWLRLKGKAVFITSYESKKAALDIMPSLRRIYNEGDAIFEIFRADEAEATFYSMGGTPRTVKL